ncbi:MULTISPECIES: CBS domain-containing protein [Paraburkholderia]|jgi:CBS domain-containing protein|uniref:CBS domain-containing protein n=1 Tax=Paraburkholderia TaxID=1822464 RepID=UPI0006D3B774|nr:MULTISPECIES: CBS domain-containing protein [Paraburkholderia]ALP66063.1 signal transduction protein [Paraburkholderia caribensis]AMV45942.1 signal transduction protein [Paraburkholderia caribensis]AUT55006.1 CBS domain-containing protein [Paraburkholderia caribensis]CAG9237747.1 Signal transduction protein [Paraburkholderia caribensis]
MKVSEFYSQGVVHIPATCSLQEAAVQMRDQHVGALIVSEGGGSGRILGVLTDRDIVLQSVCTGSSPITVRVGEVMSPQILSIDVNADITEAMQAMASHGVRRLAVVSNGIDIMGILSLDDVITALGREWIMLTSILRNEQNREASGSVLQTSLHA